jgi:hypothetical protein
MQGVLTEAADVIGRKTGFIKRFRKLSGSGFVQTLVFGWLSNPDSTVEELCQTAATLDIDISPHGLNKRFTPEASDFLQKVLESAVSQVISNDPVAIPLLQRFNGVQYRIAAQWCYLMNWQRYGQAVVAAQARTPVRH